MPTALAFDTAAQSFDRAAESLQFLLSDTPAHFGPDTLQGGLLTLVADTTVGAAQLTAATTATALFHKGDICRARAAACRAFAAELDAYHVDLRRFEAAQRLHDPTDPDATLPQRPVRPRPTANFIEV